MAIPNSALAQDFRLDNKVAFVTGASKGIGLAMGRTLGQAGATVVISSRKQDAIEEAASTLRAEGLDTHGLVCHMGDADSINNALQTTVDQHGGVDIVINNAATNPYYGPLRDAGDEVFDKIMGVNVKGPFQLCRAAHPLMKARGGGSIINVSSVEALKPDPNLGMYSVSKAALITLTQALAREWGPDGIRVNVLCPGLVKTKFSEALWTNDRLMQHVERNLPAGRIGQPKEMAGLALFLASDASSYCTGSVFVADGGYLLA